LFAVRLRVATQQKFYLFTEMRCEFVFRLH
jgi:hypothetical protein